MEPAIRERDTPTIPTDRHAALRAVRRDRVVALRMHGSGREVELGELPRAVIGSAAGCEIVLDDAYVSAAHCQLERREAGRLAVRDRRSKNGTFVNGNRIEVAEVTVGAVLTIGRTGLVALGARTRHQPSARAGLIGRDPTFRAAVDRALLAATTSCDLLIVGETGTGKELVARAIHEASSRSLGPFVAINCGAIPAELVESELFGHEKGAFTGAVAERDGLFAQADRGTLFLDEIGELPRAQQPHLLRALETRTIRRIGGAVERRIDVRLVSATNRDVEGADSPLRPDLYHRVATLVIELPPLRARPGDVPLLVAAFLAELEPEFGRREVSDQVLSALAEHPWPGNVRELRHAIHRATALSTGALRIDDLLPRRRALGSGSPPASAPIALAAGDRTASPPRPGDPRPTAFDAALLELLRDAYRQHGSVRRAAAALGIPRSTFSDRARRLGIL